MRDTRTSPGPASAATRAPMCTAIPAIHTPRRSHSPACSPALSVTAISRFASIAANAQRTARAGPSNVARNPSPIVFTSWPPNRGSCLRISR